MRRLSRSDRSALLLALVGAVLAITTQGAPTDILPVDILYRALYGFGLALAGARARRWTWFVAAGTTGIVGAASPLVIGASVVAILLSFTSFSQVRFQRELGAIVGGVAAFALLSLPTDLPFAVPTATAVLAPLPLVVSGLANTRAPRRYFAAVGVAVLLAGVAGSLFLLAMFQVQTAANDGLDAARQGLDAARDGDDTTSAASFTSAGRSLARAERAANAWWLAPARAVPVLAPHVAAVREAAGAAKDIAALSAEQIATLDLRGLSEGNGSISLPRIAELSPRAIQVVATLTEAQRALAASESPWLVPPARERLDSFEAVVDQVLPTAQNAADLLQIAPEILGARQTKRYVVLVGNPAESRELGGFVAAAGYLTAERGALSFETVGGTTALNQRIVAAQLSVTGELPVPLDVSAPEQYVQNWTNTADFSVVNDVAGQLGSEITGGSVDGTIYLDPYAVAALLRVSGPVEVEGKAERLTSEDAVDFFLRDQYALPGLDESGDRKDRLRDAAEQAFDRLTSEPLPDPRVLADVFSASTQARRLMFSTMDAEQNDVLERVGLRPPLDTGAVDQILVTQQNLRSNKLDAYISRTVDYRLDVDDDGRATGTVTVELTNNAPESGLDPYVTGDDALDRLDNPLPETLHRISLGVYTRLPVRSVRIDGAATGMATSVHGRLSRAATRVDVASGATVRVDFVVEGVFDPGDYELALVPNASAETTSVRATISAPVGALRLEPTPLDRILRVAAHAAK